MVAAFRHFAERFFPARTWFLWRSDYDLMVLDLKFDFILEPGLFKNNLRYPNPLGVSNLNDSCSHSHNVITGEELVKPDSPKFHPLEHQQPDRD